jgi:hypothetical protein
VEKGGGKQNLSVCFDDNKKDVFVKKNFLVEKEKGKRK